MRTNILLAILLLVVVPSLTAGDRPKPADGFVWRRFPKGCIEIQIPREWKCLEREKPPAHTIIVSPKMDESGGYDTGFTMNTVVCRNPEDWKNAYFSALKFWTEEVDAIKAVGTPTIEKAIQQEGMQVFIIEGERYLADAPHPSEKYRVRTVVRAFPTKGVVYVYSFGALSTEWESAWKIGETIFNPFLFRFPD